MPDHSVTLCTRFMIFASVMLMMALQIQVDILQSSSYIGLRINLGDLLVPIGGLGIIASLAARDTILPRFRTSYGCAFPIVLTGIITIALLQGYWLRGEWSLWGVVNKYCGWLVLMSLFFWGAWLRTNFSEKFILLLLKILAASALAILGVGIIELFLRDHGWGMFGTLFDYPLSGMMANRNSYSLFICCLFVALCIFQLKHTPLVPKPVLLGFLVLLPLTHILIGSRAGWVYMPIITLGLLIFGKLPALKSIAAPLVAGIALAALLCSLGIVDVSRGYQMRLFNQLPELVQDTKVDFTSRETQKKYHQQSDAYRIQAAQDALELWKTSPMFGAGLGSFLKFQQNKYGHFLDVIDNSALWLLAETGLVGLLLFAGFYGLIIYSLKTDTGSDFSRTLSCSIIGILLVFAAFSLLHEILYTRFIWVMLGLGFAVPALERIAADERRYPGQVQIQSA